MSRPRPSHAGFCPKAGYAGLDRGLAPALAEYFVARRRGARPATVGDFGAGRGWYSAYLNKVEGLAAAPYDYGARPGTAVRPFDISRPLNGTVPVFDAVLCLEVGEHVPARFEDVIFDNIATHAHDAVVLSWAAPGQPGLGHVNTLPEARVVAQMAARGWARDERASARLRAAASFPHFRAHVLAFSRAPWPPEPRGKPRGCPAPASPHSVVVLARVLYEQPFLAGFVDWYAARGVECVLLVRDGLDDAGDVAALPPVAVQRAASRGVHANAIIQATLADVRATGYAWMLVVDADEYLALHPRFDRSLPRFIEMQAARVPHLAAIQFSWAAAEALGAACPARAPFDAFFANAHVKTLARVNRVDRWVNPHAPVLRLREADCPGLPQKCSVVLNGNRAAAATRVRRAADSAEYRLSYFTGGTPRGRRPPPGSVPPAAYADAALAHVHVRSVTNVLVKACGAAKPVRGGWPDRLVANATGLRAAALARGPLDLGKFVRDAGRKGGQMLGERGCPPATVASQRCTDKRAPVDLAHLDWGPGGWTFCDAARERAIAEGVVARCLGIAADAVPRLAGAVAAAVREATRPPAQTRTAGKAKTGFWPNLPGLGLLT